MSVQYAPSFMNFFQPAGSFTIQQAPVFGSGQAFTGTAQPFVLAPNATSVPFTADEAPQRLAYNGNLFRLGDKTDTSLTYKGVHNPNQTLNIGYTGCSTQNNTVVGYDCQRVQVGTETVQCGTEQYIKGYEQVQTGTKQVQVGA